MSKINPKKRKINFMISKPVLMQLEKNIPKGQRSKFVDKTLKEALLQYARRKASEEMDKMRAKNKITLTTKEIIELKNYGRP